MKKLLLLLYVLLLASGLSGYSQIEKPGPKNENKSSIEISLDYSSNLGTYGIYNSMVSQPSLGPTVTFSSAKGLLLSATGLNIGNSDASLSKATRELDLTAGWDFNLTSDLIYLTPSYSHFIYSNGSLTSKSIYTDQAELALRGFFNWFKPSLAGDYLWGKSSAFNLNLTTAFHVEAKNFLSAGNTLGFEPSLGTNYGDNSFYYKLASINLNSLTPLRTKYGDNITIQELIALNVTAKNKQIDKQLAQLSPTATLGQIFIYTSKYQINSVDLLFPVSYTMKRLTLNSALNVSIPYNVPSFMTRKTHLFFSGGLTYSFEI